MQQTLECRASQDIVSPFPEQYLKAFGLMVVARVLDDKMAGLYRAGKIQGGVFLGRGQEALSVSIGLALRPGDIFAPLIRDGAGRLAFGEPILDAVRTYLGSALGPMRGRDGNVHRGRPREGLLAMISHLGAMISVVNGGLMAHRFQNRKGLVGAASIGDGATSTGSFHEGLNQAAVERLPLVVVVANNQYAYSTPNHRQFACDDLADKAAGYGLAARHADGTDLEDCLRVVAEAVAEARAGAGPKWSSPVCSAFAGMASTTTPNTLIRDSRNPLWGAIVSRWRRNDCCAKAGRTPKPSARCGRRRRGKWMRRWPPCNGSRRPILTRKTGAPWPPSTWVTCLSIRCLSLP